MGQCYKDTIKIAQIQLQVLADKSASIAQAEEFCARAAKSCVDLIALPEMFCCPYEMKNFPAYAEKEKGAMWQACSDIARKYGVYLSAGTMPEQDLSGKVFNTAYVFDRFGKQIAKHRKVHLFDINIEDGQKFQESATLSAGDEITTFETEFGIFGLCICYDFRFPEMGRLMAMEGAKVLLVPAAFNMTTGPMHWELMFRSQAVNNQVYAIGTAPAREEGSAYISWGHSIVADPWGKVSEMDERPGIQITELNLKLPEEVRQQLPLIKHRRTDIYRLIKIKDQDRQ